MGNGKYGAISGMIGRMRMMDNISEHLASAQVKAYKKGTPSFEAQLAEANSGMATKATNYVKVVGDHIDFTTGPLEYTGDPLHLALNGDGFFQVQRADGSLSYTRKGLFEMNGEGVLTDTNGQPIMSAEGEPLTLPSQDVEIAADGNIWYQAEKIGQIGVFQFADNSVMQRTQGSMFVPSGNEQPELYLAAEITQKNLEGSNVNVMQAMARMTVNLRAFEATQKALKIYSEMGSKSAEIGSLQ